jgi:hypothetical protein
MPQFGGKTAKKSSSDSKRHFTVVIGGKEHGLYVSSNPSSAARKAVTKLCAANKSKKVDFYIREITQGSKKKTYGPYSGHIEKLKEPIELKGRVIKYKPVAKLSGKKGVMKGGAPSINEFNVVVTRNTNPDHRYEEVRFGSDKLFFGKKIQYRLPTNEIAYYFPILIFSDGSLCILKIDPQTNQLIISQHKSDQINDQILLEILSLLDNNYFPPVDSPEFRDKMKGILTNLLSKLVQLQQQQQQQLQQQQQQQIMADNKKIILTGFNPNIWGQMYLQHQGNVYTVNISDVQNPQLYIFFDEKDNTPIGTFANFKSISSTVHRKLGYKTKIIIKIGPGGSVAALLGNPNLPQLNSNSGNLSQESYNQYIITINQIIAQIQKNIENEERRARMNPNYD